jgi:hypothetical protein
MIRRLLTCLLVLAIALPSAAMDAAARQQAAGCECPPGKSDCGDAASACDCGIVCAARLLAEPAIAVASAATMAAAFADAVRAPRPTPPASAPPDTPFRPPRASILD